MNEQNTKTGIEGSQKMQGYAAGASQEARTECNAGVTMGFHAATSERGGNCVEGDYETRGRKIGALVDEKQVAYGDSFGKSGEIMRILYPNGIPSDKIDDALCVVRIIDKLFRIASDRDALGESPYHDIAGYGLLGAARAERTCD